MATDEFGYFDVAEFFYLSLESAVLLFQALFNDKDWFLPLSANVKNAPFIYFTLCFSEQVSQECVR